MDIIHNNPYRIAGITSNATTKEVIKQKGKIKAFAKVGKEIETDYDFQVLSTITRTEDSINKAFSNIQQNEDKVSYSLFWFLNASAFDNTAIGYLRNGNQEKAIEIWGKVTQNKEINSKNFSAFSNLGTYKLLSHTQDDIKEGIEAKIKLIESDYFENFVNAVADETFTIDTEKQIKKLVDELLIQFKNKYSSSETMELFSNCNGSTQKYLSKKFTEEPIHKIESQIESVKNKRNKNKSEAYQFGLNLATKCKGDLVLLKSLLGTTNLKYKTVADQLANEIMQCGIDYFKEWQNTKDPSAEGLKLLKYARSIAIGCQTKDRVKENYEGIQEWIDTFEERKLNKKIEKEVKFIIEKLNFTVKTLNNKGKYPKGYNDPYSDLPIAEQAHNKTVQQKESNTYKRLFENSPFEATPDSKKNEFNINLFRIARELVKKCKPKLDHMENMVGEENKMFKKLSNDVANISLACISEYVNNEGNSRLGIPPNVDKHDISVILSIGELYMNPDTLKKYKTNKSTLFSMFKSTAPKSEQNEVEEVRKEIDDNRKHRIKGIIIISAVIIIISITIWLNGGLHGLIMTGKIIGGLLIIGFLHSLGTGSKRY